MMRLLLWMGRVLWFLPAILLCLIGALWCDLSLAALRACADASRAMMRRRLVSNEGRFRFMVTCIAVSKASSSVGLWMIGYGANVLTVTKR